MSRPHRTRRILRSAPAGLVALLHLVWATGLPLPVLAGAGPRPSAGCCSGKSCGCAANIRGRSCCCVAARELAEAKPKSCCESRPKSAPAESSWATVSLRAAQGCGHGEAPTLTPEERPALLAAEALPLPEGGAAGFGRCGDESGSGASATPPARPPRIS